MSKNLVDICVNLTDEVFSGNEDSIIDEANQKNITKMETIPIKYSNIPPRTRKLTVFNIR